MRRTRNGNPLDILTAIPGPELVFGLVGAVGTDLDQVADVLYEQLRIVNYQPHIIRVSHLLHQIGRFSALANEKYESDFEKTRARMEAGTELRSITKRGDALALIAIAEIRVLRQKNFNNPDPHPGSRSAYILKSLKHPDEIRSLRDVYGRAFSVVSAYAPRESRVTKLAAKIAASVHSAEQVKFRKEAEELVAIDEREENQFGQNVGDAFPLADVFVDARSKFDLKRSIGRFIELMFGNPFHTPSREEYAMFHAHAGALRSADLGRQVGAAITNASGDILSVGSNDVPKFGGGLYWPDDPEDGRDFRLGYDTNSLFRKDLTIQFIVRLQEAGLLSKKIAQASPEAVARTLARNRAFKESIANSVIEFGRSVHAEMAAITNAARLGVSLSGAWLCSTTFPCHLCARHIISSGIEKVFYIEPYPKSVAERLYSDSIVVDPMDEVRNKVLFKPFVGIAPAIYTEMFRIPRERKLPTGKVAEWSPANSNPRLRQFVLSYVSIEQRIVGELIPELMVLLGHNRKGRRGKSDG